MTEKRFVADNEYVMQNGEVYVVCGGKHSADVVATALNELLEENEQLKQEKQGILKRIDDYIWEWEDEGTPVADEMKQLKKDIEKGYLEW